MRQWERALRLASHSRPRRPIQLAVLHRCQFSSSRATQSDQGGSNAGGPSASATPPRTNKARREDALKQITRLRESRAKPQPSENSSKPNSQDATPPPKAKFVTRRVPTSSVTRRPLQAKPGSETSRGQAAGGTGGPRRGGQRTSNAAEAVGRDGAQPTGPSSRGSGRATSLRAAANGEEFDEFDDDDDDEDKRDEDDEDEEEEEETGMEGRPEDIMEEAGDEHFSSDAEQEYYAEILHKIRGVQLDLENAEGLHALAEDQSNPEFEEKAKSLEANIDAGIKEVMADLANASNIAAPPHPTKPFDPAAEYKGMIGTVPTGTAGMGNTIESSLRHLVDRDDGEYRDPMKLGQRLVDGLFNRYNTLIEKNEAHIRAGLLRPADEEKARKERNAKNALGGQVTAKLRRKRADARAAIRNIQRGIDEGLVDAEAPKVRQDLEWQKALIEALDKKLKLGREKSPYKPMLLDIEQRRQVVERLVQGRYQDPADLRLQHPALQNVARILGSNATYRPEAKGRALETLRSMIPSEKTNARRDQKQA